MCFAHTLRQYYTQILENDSKMIQYFDIKCFIHYKHGCPVNMVKTRHLQSSNPSQLDLVNPFFYVKLIT